MRIKFLEKLSFRLRGKAVPVIKVSDIEDDGRINSIELVGEVKNRDNSLIKTWDGTGWEKDRETKMVVVTDQKGITSMNWIVSEKGKTVNLYTQPLPGPNLEKVIGAAATSDDIAEALDMGKDMKGKVIFMLIGILAGWLFIGPILNGVFS